MTKLKYQELPEDDEAGGLLERTDTTHSNTGPIRFSRYLYLIILGISLMFNLLGLFNIIRGSKDICIPDPLYSPANRIIDYKTVAFNSGFVSRTPYMGPPSDAYDEAWEDLYNYGIIKVPQSDAAQLINRTLPLASEPGMYVIGLDVFHQLHCLHHLHKKAWGHDMGLNMSDAKEVERFWIHLDHCSDSIRQSLMCSSDVSTIHWQWNESITRWQADGRIVHTCRDFNAIRDWAFERKAGVVDFETWVPDPLLREV
ncbi:hypothetical protein ASPBRDRAFT_378605 [Aspergillus brasiliensis CBS 101740]|uniref:Tat pathway signal sequence n=1 Tax=Aspergillus brasiliensis (strain CBS 101740 / IMI 381727 / IBT 21946) TaxID=767769 RepID=A0A1L9UVE4_ASPBC|nr:hypothetical protein ASPBRDRAFT_378605 [Aspergillus brasiliensis CBS 101740]